MADGERFNVIIRRTDAMRRLNDHDRCAAIAATQNVIGFDRFAHNTDIVRANEIDAAVTRYL